MNQEIVMAGLAQGRILAIAEFRSGGLEFRSGRGQNGAYAFHSVTYNVEINGRPVTYQDRLPGETKPEVVDAARRSIPSRGEIVVVEHTFRSGDRGQFYMDAKVFSEAAFALSVEVRAKESVGPVIALPQAVAPAQVQQPKKAA